MATQATSKQPRSSKNPSKKNPATKPKPKRPKPKPKPKLIERPLSVRQERFCEFIAGGELPADAWIKAGHNVSREVANAASCRALKNVNLKARIDQLRKPQTKDALISKEEMLIYLAQSIKTPIEDIGPNSPLCTEYSEQVVGGGRNGRLRRGKAESGNEEITQSVIHRKVKMNDKLRALEIYAKLQGYFAPETVVIEDGPEKLKSARERALTIASPLNRLANRS